MSPEKSGNTAHPARVGCAVFFVTSGTNGKAVNNIKKPKKTVTEKSTKEAGNSRSSRRNCKNMIKQLKTAESVKQLQISGKECNKTASKPHYGRL